MATQELRFVLAPVESKEDKELKEMVQSLAFKHGCCLFDRSQERVIALTGSEASLEKIRDELKSRDLSPGEYKTG